LFSSLLEEIYSQPTALNTLIDHTLSSCKELNQNVTKSYNRKKFNKVIFTGMGSSLFASRSASIYLINNGIHSCCIDTSELLHYTSNILDEKTLLILVSQSGRTIEIVKLLESIKKLDLEKWLVTNDENCEITNQVSMVYNTHAGNEKNTSIKTYTNTVLSLIFCAYLISGKLGENIFKDCFEASELINGSLDSLKKKTIDIARDLVGSDFLSLIARGPSLSTANQGSLIIKETLRKYSESMSSGQFRHGPLEIAGEGHFAIVFAPSGNTYDINKNLAAEMKNYGSNVVFITDNTDKPTKNLNTIILPKVKKELTPLTEIIPIEFIIYNYAAIKDFNTGGFSRISKVTISE